MKKKIRKKNREKEMPKIKILITSLIVVFFVAFLGNFFTMEGAKSTWYESVKPNIAPPEFVFSIVWTIIFFLIALALYYSWAFAYQREKKFILILFAINFAFNVLWSYVYFGLREVLFAFYVLVLLWISIILLIIYLWNIERRASWLLVPYLLWVSFAGVLNYFSYIKSIFV